MPFHSLEHADLLLEQALIGQSSVIGQNSRMLSTLFSLWTT